MTPSEALEATLRSALPTTAETKLHWVVTLAFAGQASADPALAAVQRDAYLHFRSTVRHLLAADGVDPKEADREAERLIALVDGIALQAIFAPDLWSERRQREALDAGLAMR